MKTVSVNDPSLLVPAKRQKKSSIAMKTISDLPYDIIEKILELAVGTKKSAGFLNASLVCCLWNRIISESPRIMSVLSPTVRSWRSRGLVNSEKLELTRKYREFTLCNDTGIYFMSAITTRLKDSLRVLNLWNHKLDPSFLSAMSSMKLLKNLSMSWCHAEPVNVAAISFELNCLEMFETSQCILDWMNCRKLRIFRYDSEDGYFSTKVPSYSTINFLNRLEELDELIFISYEWKSDVPELKPKFMWKKLKLRIPWKTFGPLNAANSNMIALGSASAADGEAHITFYSDWLNDSQHADFTIDFLNNCKKIKTMKLEGDDGGHFESSIKAYLGTLRVLHEVEALHELECRFKDAGALIGLKNLLDKMPNLKDVTLDLRGDDFSDNEFDDDDGEPMNDEPMNDLIHIELRNLEILTVRPPMHRGMFFNIIGFGSTSTFWKTFSFGSSLKLLTVLLSDDVEISKWHSINDNGELDEKYSPIRLYKDWASAENRSSVESCILKLRRRRSHPSRRTIKKTRDEVELEVFGRLLNADEKKFFSEIIIDG